MTLHVVPADWNTARMFVREWHRTHPRPPAGHKFSIGCVDGDGRLVGVIVVGRPVARHYDDGLTLEVTRCATDSTRNANSMLYASAWRAASGLGYCRLITYTQHGESGGSLRAAGWRVIAERPPRKGWDTASRRRDSHGADNIPRTLWEAS